MEFNYTFINYLENKVSRTFQCYKQAQEKAGFKYT